VALGRSQTAGALLPQSGGFEGLGAFRKYLCPGELAAAKRDHNPPTAFHRRLAFAWATPLEDCDQNLVAAGIDD
jgi:hypothetical protein